MKRTSILLIIGCGLAAFFFTSCQKVINVDLNSTSPAIVIVGNISDQPGPYTVTLSQTVNFSEPNSFPPVNGAFVTIADNAGTTDTLVEVSPGIYHTKKIQGVQGRTYNLTVTSNGQTYTSSSTLPKLVPFDTLTLVLRHGFRDTAVFPRVGFQDPPAGGGINYFRFIETRNDSLKPNIFVIDDEYSTGLYINYPMMSDTGLSAGDSLKVEMQCIDKGAYKYLSTFYLASGSAVNVTPANPVSNISNNALGYFSAHTSRYKSLKVPNKWW